MPPPAELPDPPRSLDSKHAVELSAQTMAALRSQRRALAVSLEEAVKQIPAPLRGAARRVFGA
jgi:hypothetical protein